MTECNNKGFYSAVKGKKRKIAEEITSPEFDGNVTKLCEKYGISRNTYYRWMNDDSDFSGYCEWLTQKYSDSELPDAWRSLIKKVKAGDTQAIKLYFELKGKFVSKIDVSGGVVIIGGEDELE